MQSVCLAPREFRTSWQPKNGVTGAHVRDRARQRLSQSAELEQLWFASSGVM
jgi:hypothetical protein